MHKSLFFISLAGVITITNPAIADQCAYIDKNQAITAISRLQVGQTVYFLCEPCGDTRPKTEVIDSLSLGTVGYQDFWQVNINGQGIDLAYTYVASGLDNQWVNLAIVANCPAKNVSPVWRQLRF